MSKKHAKLILYGLFSLKRPKFDIFTCQVCRRSDVRAVLMLQDVISKIDTTKQALLYVKTAKLPRIKILLLNIL